MLNKLNHIGIAVKNIEDTLLIYKKLGLELESIEEVPSQKVKVAFIPIGEVRIELLEPTSDDSPIAKFIAKRGEGIHHLAFGTDDVVEELNLAESNDLRLIDKVPRQGAHNASIAFLHPKSTLGVLIELCQENH
ncbi:MAG: methylmalonyl-CoA epimerase [Candidatus Cloacimonetes bacterium]|nr:methylmalonyl-CoA epimerase [Candidatus Cloacimonadota bacterium]